MNEDSLNSQEESIHRLMSAAMGADYLRDDEIESLLLASEPANVPGDEQMQRIVGKVSRLIEASHEATVAAASTPEVATLISHGTLHSSQPRLVSVSTTEMLPRSNRKATIASLLALVSIVVLTSNAPVPHAISQNDHRNKLLGTLLTDLQRRQQLQGTGRYQMTAKPLPETPPVAKVAVGDEISTGELERRRVSLPDGSVLYVNSNAHVKIVSERSVEVTKGEVFVEVVPTFSEPHGASQRVIVNAAAINSAHKQLPAASAQWHSVWHLWRY